MPFTSTDLTNVEAAIRALAQGKRVVEVTTDGETVAYHKTDLNKLLDLRDRIIGEINQTTAAASGTSTSRHRYASMSKGY